ncbi:hypothetical protein [Microlunatus ginsengisoli]|uniref:Uncharacterized protein n=1 Tax=Microlunatus ginsengisoli TaxID=363863 RepID=A0ABP6ZGN3_9ACTN
MTSQTSTGYEYMTVRAPQQLAPLYRDAYRNFGWSLEKVQQRPPIRPFPLLPAIRSNTATLSFRRDRALTNTAMVGEFQRTADASLDAVVRMERSKKTIPIGVATVLAAVGTALLATCLLLGATAALPIIIGVFGLVFWGTAAIAYFALKSARTRQLEPSILAEQARVFDAGQQAAQLINSSR